MPLDSFLHSLGRAVGRATASPSKTLLCCTGSFVLAVFAHAWDERRWLASGVWVLVAACCTAAFALMRGRRRAQLCVIVALVVACALWRFDAAMPDPAPFAAGTVFHGMVTREPARKGTKMTVEVGGAHALAPSAAARLSDKGVPKEAGTLVPGTERIVGDFRVLADADNRIAEGDVVEWRCWKGADPRQGFCSTDGPLRAVGHGGFHPLYFLRGRLRAVVRGLLPEPDASLQLGLLVGDKAGVPPQLTQDFRNTGTSHVLAVSGYNVMLVADTLVLALCICGLARRRAAVLSAVGIAVFTGLAGADPPVLRAALMGGAGLVAAALGRKGNALGGLLLAAALMLALDPLSLRNDVGFRLSFAAVMGLSMFGRAFGERMTWIPFKGVRDALGETLGAIVATLPIMLHDFGSLSLTAPAVNVMIAPLIPFATATGALAVMFASLYAPLGVPPAVAAGAALRLMRAVVSWWSGAVPSLPLQIGTAAAFALYVPILLLWFTLRKPATR
ncbi:MAG: hypothetical protein RLZZ324_187 [Candidatus Parcubacteria bacterium]|jgi:competence protein ComEC